MNPALLSALIQEREADLLRELQLAGALRQIRARRRRSRREPVPPPVRPRLAPLAGGKAALSVEAEGACLPDRMPRPAA